jgi:hypothetical protein
MTIDDMHYDFKIKLNKIDSQQNKNFLIPEIDWILNDALDNYIKMISNPRIKNNLGFEINQRTIDDLRPLVVNSFKIAVTDNIVILPTDYQHYIKGKVTMSKGDCKKVLSDYFFIRQHDDNFEESPFDNSSFEWRTVNGVFTEKGIKLHTDNTFVNNEFFISYIKKHPFIHNAKSYRGATYELPSGIVLTGSQNCILPEHTHREIVDLAVLIATGFIQGQDYNIKGEKLKLNHLP